jgi:hypothetical protein
MQMRWLNNSRRRPGHAVVACGVAGLLSTLLAPAGLAAQTDARDGLSARRAIPEPSVVESKVEPETPVESPVEQSRDHRCFTPQEMRTWYKPIDQIRVSRPPSPGEMPQDCSEDLFTPPCPEPFRRAINDRCTFHWVASNMAYQPLYWDDQPLERYGQSVLPLAQPVLSGVHFFATFPVIPYEIGLDGTYDLIYTLGYYRPGDCAPPTLQWLPFQWDAAMIEAGTMTGLIFLAP